MKEPDRNIKTIIDKLSFISDSEPDDISKIIIENENLSEMADNINQLLDELHSSIDTQLKTKFSKIHDGTSGKAGISESGNNPSKKTGNINDENELKQKDKLLRNIIDHAGDAFYLSEYETAKIIDVNILSCEITGYTREELLNMYVYDIDEIINSLEELYKAWEAFDEGQHLNIDSIHRRKDGSLFPVELKISKVELEGKRYIMGFARDISDRKHAEKELLLSKFIIDKASIGIFRIANDGKILGVNEKACLSLGYPCQEMQSMYIYDIDTVYTEELWKNHRKELKKVGSNVFETYHRRKDGSSFPVEIRNNYHEYDGEGFSIAFVTDITERKKAEQQIRKSEKLLKESQKIAHLGYYTFDIQSGNWESSEALDEVFGIYPDFDKSVEGWLKIIHPDFREMMLDYLAGSVIKNEKPFNFEYKIIRFNDQQERWVHGLGELELDETGNPVFMIGTIQDITERKVIERNLWRAQFSIDQARDSVYWIKSDGMIEYVNDAACKTLGYTKEEFKNLSVLDVDPLFPERSWEAHWKKTRDQGSTRIDTIHKAKNGTLIPVEISIGFFTFNGQEFHCAFARDISERKKSESALRQSESRLSEAQRIGRIGNWDWDLKSNDLFWSDEVYRILEIEKTTVVSAEGYFNLIHSEDMDMVRHAVDDAIKKKNKYSIDHRIILPDGKVKYVHAEGKVTYDLQDSPIRMYGILQDINDLKIAEEQLKSSLMEKDVLLKELYHRTKNNMQVISSILFLQAAQIENPEVKEVFKETQNRIQAMSLVHQKLYQSQNLSRVNLKEYAIELTHLLIRSYTGTSERIKLNFNLADVSLLLDYAVPCGLILNELISNSLKHAFPGDNKGNISINLTQSTDGKIRIRYADDGIGVPTGFDFRQQESLGLQSIFSIGEHQLQGNVEFKNENGIICNIEFVDSHYSTRV